jgi:predicted RNA-binding Zn ribbon-like protein
MAGEKLHLRPRSDRQPGGRAPAPGGLGPVQAFINTHYDLGHDHGAEVLSTPGALGRWLAARGLLTGAARLGDRDLRRALAARESLRELARTNPRASGVGVPGPATGRECARAALNEASAGAIVTLAFTPEGPRYLAPADAGLDGALGALLAGAAQAMLDGRWDRLKICPGGDCGWAFYDHSRNQAGRWCSMSVCGGRAKARRHYERRQVEER